jgi:hypothetical protein
MFQPWNVHVETGFVREIRFHDRGIVRRDLRCHFSVKHTVKIIIGLMDDAVVVRLCVKMTGPERDQREKKNDHRRAADRESSFPRQLLQ